MNRKPSTRSDRNRGLTIVEVFAAAVALVLLTAVSPATKSNSREDAPSSPQGPFADLPIIQPKHVHTLASSRVRQALCADSVLLAIVDHGVNAGSVMLFNLEGDADVLHRADLERDGLRASNKPYFLRLRPRPTQAGVHVAAGDEVYAVDTTEKTLRRLFTVPEGLWAYSAGDFTTGDNRRLTLVYLTARYDATKPNFRTVGCFDHESNEFFWINEHVARALSSDDLERTHFYFAGSEIAGDDEASEIPIVMMRAEAIQSRLVWEPVTGTFTSQPGAPDAAIPVRETDAAAELRRWLHGLGLRTRGLAVGDRLAIGVMAESNDLFLFNAEAPDVMARFARPAGAPPLKLPDGASLDMAVIDKNDSICAWMLLSKADGGMTATIAIYDLVAFTQGETAPTHARTNSEAVE